MGPPRRDAVGHHALVELAEVELVAARGRVVAPKLERRDLAEEITPVRRILGAAHGLLPRGGRRQMRFEIEELRGAIYGPLAASQAKPENHAAETQPHI